MKWYAKPKVIKNQVSLYVKDPVFYGFLLVDLGINHHSEVLRP